MRSIKFVEMPDTQQLVAQHELLQARLEEVTHHAQDLDLRLTVP